MSIIKKEFKADGTTCASCEKIIKKQAQKVDGVKKISIDYATGEGTVEYDDKKTDIDEILDSIEKKGYGCVILEREESPGLSGSSKNMGWIIAIIGVIVLGYFGLRFVEGINLPTISPAMSLGLIFIVGLLTGFHCIAMCGGFVLSYTANDAKEGRSSYRSHLFYAFGKTLSYTLIGAGFGLLGSIIAFTPLIRGVAGIIAGIFLLIFGLGMLNIFPILKKFRIHEPKFLSKFTANKADKHSRSPLIIGLLNGLFIACGPLQALYIMAAGTGSALTGAKILLVFGLGTLPGLLGFGYIATFFSSKMTHKILKASGIIVIILGLFMLNNGLMLSGSGYDIKSIMAKSTVHSGYSPATTNAPQANNVAVQKDTYQEIYMNVTADGYSPDKFILKKGVPVHWIINGIELTGCNKGIIVQKYNLNFEMTPGIQTINFTPTESGVVSWSCWMGMIPGTFVVVDDLNNAADTAAIANTQAAGAGAGGSCGTGGNGGCGCGMMR